MHHEPFVHFEIHGATDEVKAFVEGFRLASGESQVYSAAAENIKIEGFLSHLASIAHRVTHYILPEAFGRRLAEAIASCTAFDVNVELGGAIRYGELAFEFRCFSRADGEAIRKVVESDLPDGIDVEGYETEEVVNDEAKGTELYSPTHEYELSGHGRFRGPIVGIIELGRRLDDQDFVHPGRIHIEYDRTQ